MSPRKARRPAAAHPTDIRSGPQKRRTQAPSADDEATGEEHGLTRAVLSSLKAQVAVLDVRGGIIQVNRAWEEFASQNGADMQTRIGVHLNYLEACRGATQRGEQAAAQACAGIEAVLDRGLEGFELEYRCDSPSEHRWFRLRASPLEGRGRGAIVSHSNITARKQAEERLHAIVTSAADAIITTGEKGIIESFNPAAERMFGYSSDEAIGHDVTLLMPDPYAKRHAQYIQRYLEGGEPRIIGIGRELVGRRKDGSTFPIDVAISEARRKSQRKFTGIVRDISERKALQRMVLEVAGAEQRRIGQDVHDGIGQELTGLAYLGHTLLDSLAEKGSADAELAEKIVAGIGRVQEQARLLTRGLIPVEIDAMGLTIALKRLAASTSETHGVACSFRGQNPVRISDGEIPTHLFRVAQEAVTNALKHAQPQHIWIALSAEQGQITLSVVDDGIGIGRIPADSPGFGLEIMRYRAGLIGASFSVEAPNEGGTRVACRLFERP